MADWKDNLAALLGSDTLPQGEDTPLQTTPQERPKPRLSVIVDRRRAGRTVTIVSGFSADDSRCAELATTLKKRMAVGGSSRGGEILIQGDRTEAVRQILKELGYKS